MGENPIYWAAPNQPPGAASGQPLPQPPQPTPQPVPINHYASSDPTASTTRTSTPSANPAMINNHPGPHPQPPHTGLHPSNDTRRPAYQQQQPEPIYSSMAPAPSARPPTHFISNNHNQNNNHNNHYSQQPPPNHANSIHYSQPNHYSPHAAPPEASSNAYWDPSQINGRRLSPMNKQAQQHPSAMMPPTSAANNIPSPHIAPHTPQPQQPPPGPQPGHVDVMQSNMQPIDPNMHHQQQQQQNTWPTGYYPQNSQSPYPVNPYMPYQQQQQPPQQQLPPPPPMPMSNHTSSPPQPHMRPPQAQASPISHDMKLYPPPPTHHHGPPMYGQPPPPPPPPNDGYYSYDPYYGQPSSSSAPVDTSAQYSSNNYAAPQQSQIQYSYHSNGQTSYPAPNYAPGPGPMMNSGPGPVPNGQMMNYCPKYENTPSDPHRQSWQDSNSVPMMNHPPGQPVGPIEPNQTHYAQSGYDGGPQPPMYPEYTPLGALQSKMPASRQNNKQLPTNKSETTKTPRRRKKRDHLTEESKQSGYANFFAKKKRQLKVQEFGQASKVISELWAKLSDEERANYVIDVSRKRKEILRKKANQQAHDLLIQENGQSQDVCQKVE